MAALDPGSQNPTHTNTGAPTSYPRPLPGALGKTQQVQLLCLCPIAKHPYFGSGDVFSQRISVVSQSWCSYSRQPLWLGCFCYSNPGRTAGPYKMFGEGILSDPLLWLSPGMYMGNTKVELCNLLPASPEPGPHSSAAWRKVQNWPSYMTSAS